MHTIASISSDVLMQQRTAAADDAFSPAVPFAAHLARESGSSAMDDRARRAREAAAQFVGAAFIQPILAQLRESSAAAGPFAPTVAEHRFGPLRDSLLADRIAQATNFPITEVIARRLLGAPAMPAEVNLHA